MWEEGEGVSTQTKSPLSPLIRFFNQNGLKHRTLGIFSFLQEAFLFNPTVGSAGWKPHAEVGPSPAWPLSGILPPGPHGDGPASHLGQALPAPSLSFSFLKWGGNSSCLTQASAKRSVVSTLSATEYPQSPGTWCRFFHLEPR